MPSIETRDSSALDRKTAARPPAPQSVIPRTVIPAEIDVDSLLKEFKSAVPPGGREAKNPYLHPRVREIKTTVLRRHLATPCPVCDARSGRAAFLVEDTEFQVVVCAGCQLGRLDPAPTARQLELFYAPEYYGSPAAKFRPWVERMVRWVGGRQVRSLTQGLPSGGRILDVGCGRGVLLKSLADAGFEAHGFEVSAETARGADPRAEIRTGANLREAEYPDQFFDAVVIWHVLEHVTNPRETLREAFRVLKPGGRLVISVPNFSSYQAQWAGSDWFHLDLPRHLFHFPLTGLRQLVTTSGFEIVSEHHFSLRQNPFGWVQSALNRFRALPQNGLYRLLKESSADGPEQCVSTPHHLWQKLAFYAGMPIGLCFSVIDAILRNGATVKLVGRKTG